MSRNKKNLIAAPALLASLLLITLAAGAGCGLTSASTASSTPPSSAVILTRMSPFLNSPIGIDHHLSASASCRPGEQMLAGGYIAQDVFESDYFVLATYPSTAATWTVSVDSGSTFQLQALVYCLSSYPSLGMQILQVNSCPAGAVPTAIGFKSTSRYARPGTPYVLCSFHYAVATSTGFRLGSTEVTCANQSTGNSLSESRTFSYICSVSG
jgi:hypothetical protein